MSQKLQLLLAQNGQGKGNSVLADQAAVDAMRKAFDSVDIDGQIVIGEGERDKAPMLFIGEKVGQLTPQAPQVDIAVDPLEGTSICAKGRIWRSFSACCGSAWTFFACSRYLYG